jgi:hypothetical protein
MTRLSQCALFLLLSLSALNAQQSSLNLSAPSPAPVTGVTANVVGNTGNAQYWYFIVATYPIGHSAPSNSAFVGQAPATLSAGNSVRVSWQVATGATAYTVLRVTVPNLPATCTACNLGTMSGTSYNDIGASPTPYVVVTAPAASSQITLDNQSAANPFLNYSLFNPALISGINKVPILNGAVTAGDCLQVGTTVGTIVDAGGACGGGGGAVSSVSNSDGSLTITPTTGAVVGSLNVAHTNLWSVIQKFNFNAVALPTAQAGTVIQIGNTDGTSARYEANAFGSTAYFSGIAYGGTNASPTALASGAEIGGFNAWGYNGAAVVGPRAAFRTYANQTWTTSANGTYADVSTTPNGATAQAEVMRFENDGGVTVPSTVTGGDKGAGTINAAGLFVNGTAVGNGSVTSVATNAPITGGTITSTGTISCVTCVTAASALTSGQLVTGAGLQATQVGNLSGDATTSGSTAVTLATVNVGPGLCGDSTHVCQVTTNGKGLVTTQAAVAIASGGSGTVTNVATTGPLGGGPITTTGTLTCTTCTTNASALTNGQLVIGQGGQATAISNLSGDVTTSGSVATTLATVNSGPGTCGDATHVCQVTTNGKGLTTSQSPIAITGGSGTVTNVAVSAPLGGGPITTTGTLTCTTCAVNLVNSVAFSATPTFNLALGDQTITLTANVTSSSLANITAGQKVTFLICQNATGGFTFAWPAVMHGPITIGTTPSLCSSQTFESFNGTTLYASDTGVINQ